MDAYSKNNQSRQNIDALHANGVITDTERNKLQQRVNEIERGGKVVTSNRQNQRNQTPVHQSHRQESQVIVKSGNGCITFLLFIIALPTLIGLLIYVLFFGAIGCAFIA